MIGNELSITTKYRFSSRFCFKRDCEGTARFLSFRHANSAIIEAYHDRPPWMVCVGEWLSLVEHLVRDQGVGGSNPLSPTNFFNYLQSISGPPPSAV
jgi:hypothetical protein